jgi:hypothetical protein
LVPPPASRTYLSEDPVFLNPSAASIVKSDFIPPVK